MPTWSPADIDAVVRTIYGEARGEPVQGQQAAAGVMVNRVRAGAPNLVAVAHEPHQFDAWRVNGDRLASLSPNDPAYQRILANVTPVLNGEINPAGNADHFVNLAAANPAWARGNPSQRIGNHTFVEANYRYSGRAGPAGHAAQPQGLGDGADIFGLGGGDRANPTPAAPRQPQGGLGDGAGIFGLDQPQPAPTRRTAPPGVRPAPPRPAHAPPAGMNANRALAIITGQMNSVMPTALANSVPQTFQDNITARAPNATPSNYRLSARGGAEVTQARMAEFAAAGRHPPPAAIRPPQSGNLAQQRYGQVRPNARNATEMLGFSAMPALGSGQAPVQSRGFTDQIVSNLGLGDELRGGTSYLRQGAGNIGRQITGQPIEVSGADAYHAGAQADRAEQSRFSADNPGMNGLATVLGIGTAGAPNAMRTAVAAGAGPVMRTGRAIINAGLSNFPFALANQNGTLAERLPGAAADTAVAAGAGGILHGIGEGLAGLANHTRAAPLTAARQISNQGVELTTGQMQGGGAQRVEDALVSTPILGDAIRARQAEGVDSFNRAGWNQVLAPLGEHLPQRVAVGRDALNHTEARVSNAYTTALRPIRVGPDATLVRDLQTVISQQADPRVADNLRTVLAQTILPRFSGRVPGQQWKAIDEELGALRRSADSASGADPMQRYFANALGDVQTAFRGTLERQHPAASAQVERANAAHAQLVRFRDAMEAASTSRRGGVVTPAQLNTSVARDAAGHSFARGDALMQNLTEPAMQVLPPTVPDSGTGLRTLINNPLKALTTAAVTVPLAAGYSRTVQGAANHVYRANSPANRAVVQDLLALAAGQAARNPVLLQGAAHELSADRRRGPPPSYPPRRPQPTLRRESSADRPSAR